MKDSSDLRKSLLRVIGVAYLFLGAIFFLQSIKGITGFVVFGKGVGSLGSFIGIAFFIIGIIVLFMSRISERYNVRHK